MIYIYYTYSTYYHYNYCYTWRVAQWSTRPAWYPKGPGFEPGLCHDARSTPCMRLIVA